MRRFITYLYEYERGHKSKNTGFIRVDLRDNQVNMEVCIRNYSRSNEIGKIYALVGNNVLVGIELGEIKVLGGQGETRLECCSSNIKESIYAAKDIVGIGICFRNNGYLASCWKDEQADKIAREEFTQYQVEVKADEVEAVEECLQKDAVLIEEEADAMEHIELPQPEELPQQITLQQEEPLQRATQEPQPVPEPQAIPEPTYNTAVTYQKIELNQIRSLPSKNWHLCNNSFLIHGFLNYGYLIIKKEVEGDEEKTSLGVPGIFEKPEMVMAIMFGFPEFEAVPEIMKDVEMDQEKYFSNIEKNQEPHVGTYGCWFVTL